MVLWDLGLGVNGFSEGVMVYVDECSVHYAYVVRVNVNVHDMLVI